MFLSKIWFFLIALAAAVALTVALVMPRPAQRQALIEEHNKLGVACDLVKILLSDDARNRVELTGTFSRAPEIVSALESAGGADKIDEVRMKQVRDIGEKIMSGVSGRKPDFAWLIDKRGRVVARIKTDDADFGDTVAGRPLVDDALAGYLRDDIWAMKNTIYLVSAAPVIKRDPPVSYAGAIVLGHKINVELAKSVTSRDVDVGFYLGSEDVASSKTLAIDHTRLVKAVETLKGDVATDCQASHPIDIRASNIDYTAVVARLPGEAQQSQAHYAVMVKKQAAIGFAGTLKVVSKSDLSPANFPWILVGGAFVLALGMGIGLMWVEADRPLRRLAADTVKLAKGEKERLGEDIHSGKYGSIARSVNISIDKLGREAKSAAKNLDSLLGPAPEGSMGMGTIDLLAGALPPARPGGAAPAAPSAPSEFKFNDPGKAIPTPPPISRTPPARPGTPPPAPPATPARGLAATPPPVRPTVSQPVPIPDAPPPNAFGLDDDILGGADPEATQMVDPYFKQVYDQFVAVKESCNESTSGLTYTKFSEKLIKNRDDLMAKTGCKEVRFTVYVKDGKAALKATPVKDE